MIEHFRDHLPIIPLWIQLSMPSAISFFFKLIKNDQIVSSKNFPITDVLDIAN